MILIDFKDSRPIYEQVVEKFRMLILKGAIVPDEKLPSVRNLAVELSINPNTIQRAYGELERQGYIYTVKGKGNFASGSAKLLVQYKEEIKSRLKELCETAVSVGMTEEELISNIREWRKL
ncbi:MAG: GntR family transcriptional regulator [Suilimivivens sp.]